jgi:hypothetical protein
MMEILRGTYHPGMRTASVIQASNDNRRKALSFGRSVIPEDAVARIFKPSRSVTTSGKARKVELKFPTLRSAIRYAERQGLRYVVQRLASKAAALPTQTSRPLRNRPSHAFSDAIPERLGLSALQENYGQAMDEAAKRNGSSGPATWSSPMDVVGDPTLALEAKRSILMNWAWTEYLIDQATNEGMPENNRPSRLHAVEQSLLALERQVESGQHHTPDRKVA